SPSTCQLSSSFNSGCQETCIEPTSFQSFCVVPSPCQVPRYYRRSSTPCSPCQGTYVGSLGFGSSNLKSFGGFTGSFGYGNTGFGAFGFGSSGIRSQGCGSNFYRPGYFSSKSIQSSYYQPGYSSGFC
uniref:Keratin-associated protein n=1 Tax=Mus spicilegus TaxID=10103 RepID=A0A8C6H125_MUSSI